MGIVAIPTKTATDPTSLRYVRPVTTPTTSPANVVGGLTSRVGYRTVLGRLLSVAGRANPYIGAGLALYAGGSAIYDYFNEENSSDTSSTAVSPTKKKSGSAVDLSKTITKINTSKEKMTMSLKEQVEYAMKSYSDLHLSLDGSSSDKTLLSVLESGNTMASAGMASIAQSNMLVSSSLDTISALLGQFLSNTYVFQQKQLAKDVTTSAFFDKLIQILDPASSVSEDDVMDYDNTLENDGTLGYAKTSGWVGGDFDTYTETVVDSSTSGGVVSSDSSDTDNENDLSSLSPSNILEALSVLSTLAQLKMTPAELKDLDGNVISTMTPLEAETANHISTARKHTDENNFELEDEDFDMWDSLPVMDFLHNFDYSHVDDLTQS